VPKARIFKIGVSEISRLGLRGLGQRRNQSGQKKMSESLSSNSLPGRHEQATWLQTRPGERCLIRVPAAETSGTYSFVEIVSEPGDGTPLHVHRHEDEYLFVLEGTGRFAVGGKIFDAEAGTMVTLPRNIPNAWGNRSGSRLRIGGICYPGGVEEALRIIAGGGVIDIPALADRFGVISLGPTPF
jgi:mannose-6-phosphate isomerase-like protein (cupin superfamily)